VKNVETHGNGIASLLNNAIYAVYYHRRGEDPYWRTTGAYGYDTYHNSSAKGFKTSREAIAFVRSLPDNVLSRFKL
jgi:hypothetical protein